MPVSETSNPSRSPCSPASRRASSVIRPPLVNLAALLSRLNRALADLDLVRAHHAQLGAATELERVAVPGHQRLDCRADVGEHGGDVELLDEDVHLAGLDLRQVEDVVDQAEQVLAGAADLVEVGLEHVLPQLRGLLEQHLAVADDRVQRRPELVAHVGEEGRLRLARPHGLVARGGEFGGALPHELLQTVVEALQPDICLVDLARLLLGDRLGRLARLPLPLEAPLEPLDLAHGGASLLVRRNRAAVPAPPDRSSVSMSTASP